MQCAECKNLQCLDHENQTVWDSEDADDVYCTLCFHRINDKFLYCKSCDMWYEDRTAFVHIDRCKGKKD